MLHFLPKIAGRGFFHSATGIQLMFGKDGPTFFELIHQALVSTRQGYDMLAPKFDATPFRTPDMVLEPAIAVIGPVDAALDICCGTGAAMRFLKPLCRSRLTGVDFSSGMLSKARENMAEVAGSCAVEFIETDVLAMSFHEAFDVATCFGALGHILPKDQRTFLQNIRQALKPGGRFVFVTAPHPKLWSLAGFIFRTFDAIMAVRNWILKPPFIMYYLNFLLPEIESLLKEEGFLVEIRPGFLGVPFQRSCLVIATRIPRVAHPSGVGERSEQEAPPLTR